MALTITMLTRTSPLVTRLTEYAQRPVVDVLGSIPGCLGLHFLGHPLQDILQQSVPLFHKWDKDTLEVHASLNSFHRNNHFLLL